jgi:hypothetical protein
MTVKWEKKTHTNCAGESFVVNFPTHVHLEINFKISKERPNQQYFNWQERLNQQYFNGQKTVKKICVLTDEKLDINHWLQNSSQKSLLWLVQQSAVYAGSAWTVTKLLRIRPYKITVVPEIKLWIMKKKLRFVIGLSIMCMIDLLILSWHVSQMRLLF